jgi:hypothetical protein
MRVNLISAGDGNLEHAGDRKHVIRRSITIDDELNKFINRIRARYLEEKDKEIDFTTALNMLAIVGMKRVSSQQTLPQEELEIIQRFMEGEDPDFVLEH